ncbi:MAG: hypothetical protein ACK4UN_14940 [Limisphaerales bacterium]
MNKDLWSQGKLCSYTWAWGVQRCIIIPHDPKYAGGEFWVREIHSFDAYDGPDDEWQDVWKKIAGFLEKKGTYQRPDPGIEAWMSFDGAPKVNESGGLEIWPEIAGKLQMAEQCSGLLAVRGQKAKGTAPGFTVVVDKKKLTKKEKDLFEFSLELGSEGAYVRQEDSKWLLIKAIYDPATYVTMARAPVYGVDWKLWKKGPVDENETRRIWSERAGVLVQMLRGCPAVDSAFFDHYVVCDAVEKLPQADQKILCEAKPECLAETISGIQEKPTLN